MNVVRDTLKVAVLWLAAVGVVMPAQQGETKSAASDKTLDASDWTWVYSQPNRNATYLALAGPDRPTITTAIRDAKGPVILANAKFTSKAGATLALRVLAMDLTNCDPRAKGGSFTMADSSGAVSRLEFVIGSNDGSAVLANALCHVGLQMLAKK